MGPPLGVRVDGWPLMSRKFAMPSMLTKGGGRGFGVSIMSILWCESLGCCEGLREGLFSFERDGWAEFGDVKCLGLKPGGFGLRHRSSAATLKTMR